MIRIAIVCHIENAEAKKMIASQKHQEERKTTLSKPCGHAAPVDSFATHPANLTTSAWTAQRRPHAHKADGYIRFATKAGNNAKTLAEERMFRVDL